MLHNFEHLLFPHWKFTCRQVWKIRRRHLDQCRASVDSSFVHLFCRNFSPSLTHHFTEELRTTLRRRRSFSFSLPLGARTTPRCRPISALA
jgi:hypothetical protein